MRREWNTQGQSEKRIVLWVAATSFAVQNTRHVCQRGAHKRKYIFVFEADVASGWKLCGCDTLRGSNVLVWARWVSNAQMELGDTASFELSLALLFARTVFRSERFFGFVRLNMYAFDRFYKAQQTIYLITKSITDYYCWFLSETFAFFLPNQNDREKSGKHFRLRVILWTISKTPIKHKAKYFRCNSSQSHSHFTCVSGERSFRCR